jgi:hypothetical protein
MSQPPARITQADVARTIRAAKQAGAGVVEVRPDGTMLVHLSASHDGGKPPLNPSDVARRPGARIVAEQGEGETRQ